MALFLLAHAKPVIFVFFWLFLQVENSAKLQDSLIMQPLSSNALSRGASVEEFAVSPLIKKEGLLSVPAPRPTICNFRG